MLSASLRCAIERAQGCLPHTDIDPVDQIQAEKATVVAGWLSASLRCAIERAQGCLPLCLRILATRVT